MPKFQKCPQKINDLALEILCEFETHKMLLDAKVKIDFVFAFADEDDECRKVNYALTKNGVRALAIARKIPLKDRAMGRGDCEVSIDHDHWEAIDDRERRALLDHELHHFAVKIDKRGLVRDDLGRPVINIRKHDYEFGWFRVIAERHAAASVEVQQAAKMFSESGQAFWPDIIRR